MAENAGGGPTLKEVWETFTSVWQAFIVPAGVLFAGAWKSYVWFTGRADHKKKQDRTMQEQAFADATRDREQLSRDVAATIKRKDDEIGSLYRRVEELQVRADRFSEAFHEVGSLRQMVNALQHRAKLPVTIWPPWSWNNDKPNQ